MFNLKRKTPSNFYLFLRPFDLSLKDTMTVYLPPTLLLCIKKYIQYNLQLTDTLKGGQL